MVNMTTKLTFRLWNKKEKRFVRGYQEANSKQTFDGDMVGCAMDSKDTRNLSMSWWNEPDDYLKICRYTGLKDKNGKEIYEGDIVSIIINNVNKGKYEIKWNEYKWYPFSEGIPPIYTGTKLEVIGNIYENPELIK